MQRFWWLCVVKHCRWGRLCQGRRTWHGKCISRYGSQVEVDTCQVVQPRQENIDWEMPSTEEIPCSLEPADRLPSVDNLICILQKCRKRKNLAYAKCVHVRLCGYGLESHRVLGNYVVPMFVECESLLDAQQVFNRLVWRNEFSWTILMQGYLDCGKAQHALDLFVPMHEDSIHPSTHTFVVLLKCCAKLTCILRGQEIHTDIIKEGFERVLFVGNMLLDMYAKCGSLMEARKIFDDLRARDIVSWSALITGYADCGLGEEALMCFRQMQLEGMSQDGIIYICCLKACGNMEFIHRVREMHSEIVEQGFESDLYVGNTLLDMYTKCGSLVEAQKVFDKLPVQDVVSWTALIAGYADHGCNKEALNCFDQMQLKGVSPNMVTFVSTLRVCGSIGVIDRSLEMHAEIVNKGYELESPVRGYLVDLYIKCGLLGEAEVTFESLLLKDAGAWKALIMGYAEHGLGDEAMACFRQMQLKGVSPDIVLWNSVILGYAEQRQSDKAFNVYLQMQEQGLLPNNVTFLNILRACGDSSALGNGKRAHTHLHKDGGVKITDTNLTTALQDMYGRCGSMVNAQQVFDATPLRDLVAWNALITGYAHQGQTEPVFHLFHGLQEEGIRPDATTFLGILNVCNHMGLLEMGCHYFESMSKEHGITPTIKHHSCMLDLLGRAGHFNEVVVMLEKMPFQPDLAVWHSVADAGRKWHNVGCERESVT